MARIWSCQLCLCWLLLVVRRTATSTVYFREKTGGSIFALDSDGGRTELEGSSEYARFVGLAMHRRNRQLFWSDGRSVKSANAADGSEVRVVVGALARVVWVGTNFGAGQDEIQMLVVKDIPCVSILSWSMGRVECIVGIPQRFTQDDGSFVGEEDCTIRTTHGSMTGSVLDFDEMVVSGTPGPIVKRIDIYATFVLPHALAIDDREGRDWLYWSNSADGRIYRSSLQSTATEVLQENCWSVRGLVLNIPQDATTTPMLMFYSLESKGTISEVELPQSDASITSPPTSRVIISGLRSPRGLAVDSTKQLLFFTEKTGRIFQVALLPASTVENELYALPDDTSIVAPNLNVQRIITRTSRTRLDGIAVDSEYVYWCETNSNVVARASRRDFQRNVMVGGTANSQLTWPRGIVLGSDDASTNDQQQSYYYSEYVGRISSGAAQNVVVDELSASSMQYLDNLVKASSVQRGKSQSYFYALE